MNNLFDENYLNELPKNITDNLNFANDYVIKSICKRLKNLNSVDISKLKNALEYANSDLKDIKKKLAKINKTNVKEIEKIFEDVAKNNVEFANIFYKYRGLDTLKSYKNNKSLKKLVEAIKLQTIKKYNNISRTTGFKTNNTFKTIREQYINIIDKGITAITTGTMDYNTAIRQSVKGIAKSGVVAVDFESGYARRLDSQARMNILEGVSELNMKMLDITSKEYGADGYEITAHALCAPDHQPIQGMQYTKKEYEALNSNLKRPVGTLNCKHIAVPIVLGVSEPTYSKKELKEITALSNKKVSYNGNTYTRYEASQEQRKLETKIRKQKEVIKALEYVGDNIGLKESKKKLKELMSLYKDFSESVGLSTYPEKLRI